MKIISKDANPGGSYFGPQDWPEDVVIPMETAVWPTALDPTDFYAYNGFVILDIEQVEGVDTATSYRPNLEAWEAWKQAEADKPQPEPEPTETERLRADVDFLAAMAGVAL